MKVALHLNRPIDVNTDEVDRIYIGERFCAKRFFKHLPGFVKFASNSSVEVWLVAPESVHENDLDKLTADVVAHKKVFGGVLAGDFGLAYNLSSEIRVIYSGTVNNTKAIGTLVEYLGIEGLRLFPPHIDILESIAPRIQTEIVVYGRLPLAATPRCPTMAYLDCDQCEIERPVFGGAAELVLRGNTVYMSEPIRADGLMSRIIKAGTTMAIVEVMNLSPAEITSVCKMYRDETIPANSGANGIYFGNPDSFLLSSRWMRLIPCTHSDDNSEEVNR